MLAIVPASGQQHPTTPERAQARPTSGYIPTLDGWRAIAIVWVIYAHLGRNFGPITHTIADWGEHGVQLFFALSGYLICTRLLREERSTGTLSLKSFYTRRFFRIQPPAVAYLLFLAVLSLLGIIPSFWRGILGAALMVRNLWPGQVGHQFWYTSHFWSLAVEEHFYFLLPAFLLLVRRNRLAILALTVFALDIWRNIVFDHRFLQQFGWLVDLRTDVVIAGILIGSVAAIAMARPDVHAFCLRWLKPWVAFAYTAVIFTFFSIHLKRYDYQFFITTYPLLLIATSLHPNSPTGRFLELPAMRFIGRISYSLYIWQQFWMWPVIWAPEIWLHKHPSLCVPLLFACAIASYYWVELPLVRVGHRLAKRFDQPRPAPQPVEVPART